MTTNGTLSSRASWLFILGSMGVGVGSSYAVASSGTLVSGGVYFAAVLIGALLATRKTLATAGGTIGRVLLLGVLASVAHFLLVRHAAMVEASTVHDLTEAQAHAAGAAVGGMFGVIVAVATFIEAMIAGTIGALIGARGK